MVQRHLSASMHDASSPLSRDEFSLRLQVLSKTLRIRTREWTKLRHTEDMTLNLKLITGARRFATTLCVGGFALLFLGNLSPAGAQELLRIPTTAPNNGQAFVEGVLSVPAGVPASQARPAVILLHAGGGWEVPVTSQYAKALNQAGFSVLELRLFKTEAERATSRMGYLQNIYDALRFLGTRPDIQSERVSLAGFSFGGILTLTSATAWAYERFGGGASPRFAAHAAFYPVCYGFAAFAKAGRPAAELPADLLRRWTGAPVRIFAAGKDDYDDRDPKVCEELVSLIPEPQRGAFSVTLYLDATHGWDQPSASFFEKVACKGRGCMNRNVANPAVTAKSVADLAEFMSAQGR